MLGAPKPWINGLSHGLSTSGQKLIEHGMDYIVI